MAKPLTKHVTGRVLIGFGILLVLGCDAQPQTQPQTETPVVTRVPDAAVEVTDEMADILAKADQVDGTTDKLVANCAVCLLGMAGSSEHTLAVGDYTLRFCSDHCKQTFAQDAAKSVVDIQFPSEQRSGSP